MNQTAMETPIFLQKFQCATTDNEKLRLIVKWLDGVAAEYRLGSGLDAVTVSLAFTNLAYHLEANVNYLEKEDDIKLWQDLKTTPPRLLSGMY